MLQESPGREIIFRYCNFNLMQHKHNWRLLSTVFRSGLSLFILADSRLLLRKKLEMGDETGSGGCQSFRVPLKESLALDSRRKKRFPSHAEPKWTVKLHNWCARNILDVQKCLLRPQRKMKELQDSLLPLEMGDRTSNRYWWGHTLHPAISKWDQRRGI